MNNVFEVFICSPPDREKIVASIMFDNIEWAEVNQESCCLQVEFYSRPDGLPWRIDLSVAMKALKEAEQKLRDG